MEGRPLEDAELIRRAKDGDVAGYEELVRRHQAVAVRTAYILTRGAADAEDVAQEALVKAYRALHRFRDGAPFRPWLLRIVANEASNRRRAAGRHAHLAFRLAEVEDRRPGDAAPSPEAAVLASEKRAAVLEAVNRLGERDRAIIGLRFFLGLPEAEVAAVLGCAIGTVKSRQSRAIGRLRAILGDEGSERV